MKTPNTPSPNDTKGQKRELLAHLMTGKRIKEYWLSDDYLASHWNKGQV